MIETENKNKGYLHTRWGWIFFFIIPLMITALFAGSAIVMLLWNKIIPGLFPAVGTLTYWHALGLLVLCKMLFGSINNGFLSMRRPPQQTGIQNLRKKWAEMTEEKKAKLEAWKTTHHHKPGER